MKYSYAEKKAIKDFIRDNHEKLTIPEIMKQKRISERMVMNLKVELGLVKRRPKRAQVVRMHTDVFNVHVMKNWLVGAE